MMRLRLFYRLIVRPLFHEPVRLGLMVLSVALGVAVVLAIELAGTAAAGSFHSSMETLTGDNDLEVVASGGVPERIFAALSTEAEPIRVTARMEDFLEIAGSKQSLPLIGVDLIGEGNRYIVDGTSKPLDRSGNTGGEVSMEQLLAPTSIWVGDSLKQRPGNTLELSINDRSYVCTIRGVYPDSNGNENAIVMDIAAAQHVLGRSGTLDRILIKLPQNADPSEWEKKLSAGLPEGVQIRPQGSGREENRKMLAAFRWNLRLLSYIALVVGAFLIYNTISVSVVRRRPEIGVVRALGASRSDILFAFLGEASCLGAAGALVGLPLGRVMASGAVKLMGLTVESLYVSSRPGPIELSSGSVALALLIGIGVAVVSALAPTREAMQVSPVDAMARGRREYTVQVHKERDLLIAVVLAALGAGAAKLPPVAGKPLFGYLATILLIAGTSFAMPALVSFISRATSTLLGRWFGVEALLASRSLAASLRRTSVLVAALATSVAMMVSVGIMVGSFRETVVAWMGDELPADLYLRPAGNPAADRHPTISPELAEKIVALPGVAGVQRLRAYEITYDGMPATLVSVDLHEPRDNHHSDFISGRSPEQVLGELRGQQSVIVSEPFTYKHHVKAGDTLTLALGEKKAAFRIADVTYDYSSERGYILMDRDVMLSYLPDPTPSNLAIFLQPGTDTEAERAKIQDIAAGHHILMFSDKEIRGEAVRIFDRTFAITYALEAVAIVVAVMGIAGALIALVIDRRHEFGLLRFLGASSGQLRKLILVEAGLLGLLATATGFVLGYVLSLILVFVINKQSFGWTIRFHWPVSVLLGALTVVYLATVLAGLYPARLAVRLNPLEVVHEE
jgi:putative ABC transport system permease protein